MDAENAGPDLMSEPENQLPCCILCDQLFACSYKVNVFGREWIYYGGTIALVVAIELGRKQSKICAYTVCVGVPTLS